MEHFAVHDPIQGRKIWLKNIKKIEIHDKIDGPDYILEPNPDLLLFPKNKLKNWRG